MKSMFPTSLKILWTLLTVMLINATGVTAAEIPNGSGAPIAGQVAGQVAWLEPRGLSIVELVGQVPETKLQGAILSYNGAFGILRYLSGSRQGDKVTVNVSIHPRWMSGGWTGTLFGCLGQPGRIDHWGVTVPQSTLRLFENGQEITDQLTYFEYFAAGQIQPIKSASDTSDSRYPEIVVSPPQRDSSGAVIVPANQGCQMTLTGIHDNLTATFVVDAPQAIDVTLLGEESFTFHSYIGGGYAGELESLRSQMERFGARHEKFTLSPPTGSEFIFVNYPPTPADAYTPAWFNVPANVAQPSSGTYRLATNVNTLSSDHTGAYAMPLQGQWRDADQAGGSVYLPYLRENPILAAPEYFLPAGVPYDPCMTGGGCSDGLLQQIYNTPMTMTVLYLSVRRTDPGLDRIPLKQVGPSWSPGAARMVGSAQEPRPEAGPRSPLQETIPPSLFLPLVMNGPGTPSTPPEDPTGCPCGWFDQAGQMLDFTPGP